MAILNDTDLDKSSGGNGTDIYAKVCPECGTEFSRDDNIYNWVMDFTNGTGDLKPIYKCPDCGCEFE